MLKEILKHTHPKLENCIKRMILDDQYPFYGEFNLNINFKETEEIPTAAVYISKNGSLNFLWNREFFDSLTQKQANFLDLHEIFHLLFSHPQRTVRGSYDRLLANYVQDMIINSTIVETINKNFIEIPTDKDEKNSALFIPKEYSGPIVFEALYEWVKVEADKRRKETDNSEDSEGGENNSDNYGKNGKAGDDLVDCYDLNSVLDGYNKRKDLTLDTHLSDEVSQEVKDSIISDLTKKISEDLKMRGYSMGNLEGALERLQKKRKDYLKEIKRTLNSEIFGDQKYKTILRPNRKNIFGLKGNKKVKSIINCILDTSGSMCGEFEKTLAFIFRNDIQINLIQIDTKVRDVKTIKRMNELQKVKIKGLGGTILQPAVDKMKEDYKKFNTVILTDGYTDSLDFSNYDKKVLIISTSKEVPIKEDNNNRVKQIIVDKE